MMLVRYPMVDCYVMAESIRQHLDVVAGDQRFSDALRSAAARSSGEWAAMLKMRLELARQHRLAH